jgi:hypothetical protein
MKPKMLAILAAGAIALVIIVCVIALFLWHGKPSGTASAPAPTPSPAPAAVAQASPTPTPEVIPPFASQKGNIVASDAGGVIESITSEYGPGYTGNLLIDGSTATAWKPRSVAFPQEMVFSFFNRQTALISSLVLTAGPQPPAPAMASRKSPRKPSPPAAAIRSSRFRPWKRLS